MMKNILVFFLLAVPGFSSFCLNAQTIDSTTAGSVSSSFSQKENKQTTNYRRWQATEKSVQNFSFQQAKLAQDQVFLAYSITDTLIFIDYITKDSIQKLTLSHDFPLAQWANYMRENLENPDFTASDFALKNELFIRYSHLLYDKIIAPLEIFELPKKLWIKPDGVLQNIPFEILLTASPEHLFDYENHPYLLKKHQITYYHPPGEKQEITQTNHRAPKLFMNFVNAKNVALQKEATAIYRKFGGDIFCDEAATQQVLQEESPLHQAIHFPDLNEQQIQNLPSLNAALVVYSTNQILTNKILALKQMIEKNPKAVVTNLWTVSPEKRLVFFKKFYHHIYQRRDKDEALQKAKLSTLRWTDQENGHPHFWAAYILFGDNEGIDLQGFRYDLMLEAILILMLTTGLFLIHKNII